MVLPASDNRAGAARKRAPRERPNGRRNFLQLPLAAASACGRRRMTRVQTAIYARRLRRRKKPSIAKALPNKPSVPGSGTAVAV